MAPSLHMVRLAQAKPTPCWDVSIHQSSMASYHVHFVMYLPPLHQMANVNTWWVLCCTLPVYALFLCASTVYTHVSIFNPSHPHPSHIPTLLTSPPFSHPHPTTHQVRVSFLEVYNEEVRDLLSKDPKQRLEVHENEDGVYVKGLSSFVVRNVEEMTKVLEVGVLVGGWGWCEEWVGDGWEMGMVWHSHVYLTRPLHAYTPHVHPLSRPHPLSQAHS